MCTPLKVEAWTEALRLHPNTAWATALISGLTEGVCIGFQPNRSYKCARSNCFSARQHPYVVDKYLATELAHHRIVGPFDLDLPGIMINRFGVIPKSGKPGKWRLIVDLSAPTKFSINDGVSKTDASMVYSSVADAARMILSLGQHTEMAKIDLANAFRIIPVHPNDRHLLGMKWNGKLYIDQQLPFGLRSAPVLFNGYADALEWIMRNEGVQNLLHYLDDFLVLGPAGSGVCQAALCSMLSLCDKLGVPLAHEKIVGPTTSLVFLGILLDSTVMETRLPEDKLVQLTSELQVWSSKKSCSKKELERLLGLLNFVCLVIPQGRCFLRRMFNLLHSVKEPNHFLRLNCEF